MNLIKITLVLNFLCLSLATIAQVEGKAVLERVMVDSEDSSRNIKTGSTIWYRDDMSIQEVKHIDLKVDSAARSPKVSLLYFLLIDPGSQQYLYYSSFSDTSRLLYRFEGMNPVSRMGGWDMYSPKKFDYTSYRKIPDTSINGKVYGRFLFERASEGLANHLILYTDCKEPSRPVSYLKPFYSITGCPVVRMDTYSNGKLVGISQLVYLSDTLSPEERKVFTALEKKL
jgi:hypothetical protein